MKAQSNVSKTIGVLGASQFWLKLAKFWSLVQAGLLRWPSGLPCIHSATGKHTASRPLGVFFVFHWNLGTIDGWP